LPNNGSGGLRNGLATSGLLYPLFGVKLVCPMVVSIATGAEVGDLTPGPRSPMNLAIDKGTAIQARQAKAQPSDPTLISKLGIYVADFP